ncbi:MAG: DNA polymerase III subunit delta [Finegoldia sp.]|nr:DNA polymerase III subunit delta [Finegoldia sp.]
MDYQLARKRLKDDQLNKVVLVYGSERYLVEKYVKDIKDHYKTNDAFSYNIMDINDYVNVYQTSQTVPMLNDKRIIHLKDVDLTKSNTNNLKKATDYMISYMDKIPPYTIILISSNKSVFKSKFVKEITKIGGCVIEFNKLNRNELKSYINNYLKGKQISNDLVNMIIDYSLYLDKNSDKSLIDLNNELDKLLQVDGDHIDRKDLEAIVAEDEKNIFKLTDAIGERSKVKALRYYNYLVKESGDVYKTFYMVVRTFRNLLYVKELERLRYSKTNILKALKLSDFEYKKVSSFSGNWKYKELREAIHTMYQLDVSFKSTSLDEDKLLETKLLELL